MNASVIATHLHPKHDFSKTEVASINVLTGLGIEGDAHCGETVKHRSRVAKDPSQPNLRQVHLIHNELFEEVLALGFILTPGQLGENVTTQGIDLLALPLHSILRIGLEVELKVTGLRNPCGQIENFQKGLLSAVLEKDEQGKIVRKAGIMCIVLNGGMVKSGDAIAVELPSETHQPLTVV